jgi:hypothetical protein
MIERMESKSKVIMPEFNEENNVYAFNVKGEVLHISQAESGRQGYFCLGCDREMQAVISRKANRISYFRHDPKAVKNQKKCTYSDETYRHQLAKEILQRLKRIKVPAVYKYPPKGNEGHANLLVDSMFIEAASVRVEKTFYEDEEGRIHWGSNPNIEEKFLLIKPDVTFFNKNDEPILFIELVATHGITSEKLIKFKRLGINTIQVKIPKESPEAIEGSFFITDKVKWVYNYEEERTEYVPVSHSDTEGVLSIDELQRKLFEESFSCRAAQIRSLIRTIGRCLESKPYREIEGGIRSEISRVERNAEASREQWHELQERLRKEVFKKYESKYTELESRRETFSQEAKGFQHHYKELEERYYSKREQLEGEEEFFERRVEGEIKSMGGEGKSIEERKNEIDEEERRIEQEIRGEEDSIRRIEEEQGRLPEELAKSRIRIEERIKLLGDEERRRIGEVQEFREQLPNRFAGEEEQLRAEFEELYRRTDDTIQGKIVAGDSELSRRVKSLLEGRELLYDFEKAQVALIRSRTAWESFKSGAYKSWND